jgi:hypothetical protein
MTAASLSLVLAVSTAWFTIFLNAQRAPLLRFYPRHILLMALSWVGVAVFAPATVLHWYLIFAFLSLMAWMQIWGEHYLSAKIWLGVVSALGISLGVVFLLVAAPDLCPATLPASQFALLLGSIYSGGAIAGLALAARTLALVPETRSAVGRYARLLGPLSFLWIVLVLVELDPTRKSPSRLSNLVAAAPLLLILLAMTGLLSVLAARALSGGAWLRADRLLSATAFLALVTQLLARNFHL